MWISTSSTRTALKVLVELCGCIRCMPSLMRSCVNKEMGACLNFKKQVCSKGNSGFNATNNASPFTEKKVNFTFPPAVRRQSADGIYRYYVVHRFRILHFQAALLQYSCHNTAKLLIADNSRATRQQHRAQRERQLCCITGYRRYLFDQIMHDESNDITAAAVVCGLMNNDKIVVISAAGSVLL